MNIVCWLMGHTWSFPMQSLRGGEFPGYICIRCNKKREEGDLTNYGCTLFGGGGWRIK